MGGEGSFEETSVEDGALDPSYSLSMQDPYLTPGSDGSSSHPPPPYTLQVRNTHSNPFIRLTTESTFFIKSFMCLFFRF